MTSDPFVCCASRPLDSDSRQCSACPMAAPLPNRMRSGDAVSGLGVRVMTKCPVLAFPGADRLLAGSIRFGLTHWYTYGCSRGVPQQCHAGLDCKQLLSIIRLESYSDSGVSELVYEGCQADDHPLFCLFCACRQCKERLGVRVIRDQPRKLRLALLLLTAVLAQEAMI